MVCRVCLAWPSRCPTTYASSAWRWSPASMWSLGGYMATAMNDFIQGIVMLARHHRRHRRRRCTARRLYGRPGRRWPRSATPQVLASIPRRLRLLLRPRPPEPAGGGAPHVSLGTWGLPQMVQKFYAIKTRDPPSTRACIISTLFALVVAGGCYFLGGFGRLYEGQIEYAANGTPIYGFERVDEEREHSARGVSAVFGHGVRADDRIPCVRDFFLTGVKLADLFADQQLLRFTGAGDLGARCAGGCAEVDQHAVTDGGGGGERQLRRWRSRGAYRSCGRKCG